MNKIEKKRACVIEYLLVKNTILRDHGAKEDLTKEADIAEIKTWSYSYITKVYNTIRKELYRPTLTLTLSRDPIITVYRVCPWCILYNCDECTYKDRNNKCVYNNSVYGRIVIDIIDHARTGSSTIAKVLGDHASELLKALTGDTE